MRLTLINQFYTPDLSPTAHLSDSLANHRAAQGDEVTVVASKGGYVAASGAAESERECNPRVHRIWTPRLGKSSVLKRCIDYGTFYLLASWRMLRLPRQDVIISLTTPPYIAWTAVLHKMLHRRTKLILWNMDCYPELAERSDKIKRNGLISRVMRVLNRALFRRLDHLVCLDTAMVDLLMSQYAPSRRELAVSVIPNWEQAEFFPESANPEPWAKADELGLADRFVVLYLGNMGYGHRFETVLDTAEQMRDEPVTFLFIGGGSRWQTVEDERTRRDLTNVILLDYVPKAQTPSVMGASHCALITLRDEILGVMSPSKLHSNLAMRLPVAYVGPPKSNVDDAIIEHACGVSLRHGESDKLTIFIRSLMSDDGKLKRLSAAARKAFDESYCDRSTLPRFDDVIDATIGRERVSRPEPAERETQPQREDAGVTIRS